MAIEHDRRGFLKCMTWAGSGLIWSVAGGIPRARLIGSAQAAAGGFSFAQVSDSHLGFDKPVNTDVTGTFKAGLAPLEDAFAFARMQEFNSYLCSTLHVAHARRMRGSRWASDPASFADMARKVPESVAACYALIEAGMQQGPWAMGRVYTVADPYLFTIAQWMEGDGIDPARFPRVADHRARMAELPNVARAVAAELAE